MIIIIKKIIKKDSCCKNVSYLECVAAFELFTKDTTDQLLGVAELDLVLRGLGQEPCLDPTFEYLDKN